MPSGLTVLKASVSAPVSVKEEDEPELRDEHALVPNQVERARNLVKGPSMALMIAGFLGLLFNLFYCFILGFVTPSTKTNMERQQATETVARPRTDKTGTASKREDNEHHDRASGVMGFLVFFCLAVACGMALGAGFAMQNLRNYKLSIAGSLAIMPGACFCCLAGVPIGIWSIIGLAKPEVYSAFK